MASEAPVKTSPARILFYLAIGFVGWLWLQGIGTQATDDVSERREIQAAQTALKIGDSLRATRMRAKALAGAKAAKGLALLREAMADTIPTVNLTANVDSLFLENRKLKSITVRIYEAAVNINEARLIDSTRADAAEAQLAVMEGHTKNLMARLEGQRSFSVGFITLPKPKKWQAALGGALIGAVLDRKDPLRGATAGGLGAVLLVPTR